VIGELARRTVAETDFYALLAKENPLVNAAAPCFAARVELRRLSVGGVELALTPVGGGVELHATLSDIAVGFHVKYEAFCKNDEGEVSFTTERFRLDGKLALSLGDGGKITADASQTVAAFDRFVWGGDVLPARVRELLDQPLADALAVLIAGEVSKRVPALITRRVDGKPRTTEVRGEELVMALRPAALLADDRGLAFALDSSIYVSGAPGTVFPRTPAAPPALDAEATRGLRLAIADDALNQLLASLWGAGVFDQDLDIEQTDRLEQLGLVFDHLSFVPRLPPVAEAMPNGGGLRLTAGDVECQLVQRPEGLPPRVVARVVVSLRVTVVASVVDDRLMLRPMAPELFVDVPLEPGDPPSPLHEESLRALGDFVTDNLVTLLGEVVSGVPLPGLDELSIVDARAGSPPAGGYLELVGDVRLR